MSSKIKDITGVLPSGIVAKAPINKNRSGQFIWKCVCHCGKEFTASSDHLTRKRSPIKSCGCKMASRGPDHHQWSGCGQISGNWWYNHVERERKQNKRIKVPVTITIEQGWDLFQRQGGLCALSGLRLTITNCHPLNTASVDRIDSSKGYEPGNIQFVHKHINFMKRTYSQEYFIEMCKLVAKNHGEKNEA